MDFGFLLILVHEKDCQAILSRPIIRKVFSLLNCQYIDREGRIKALKAARSLGERTCIDFILHHQNPQQLTANLWSAVRSRGCQFLGPGFPFQQNFRFSPIKNFGVLVLSFSDARRSIEIDFIGIGRWFSIIT